MVFHVAADYRLWTREPEEMYRSNVEGTRAMLEAPARYIAAGPPCNHLPMLLAGDR